jgi:hypothetical protein
LRRGRDATERSVGDERLDPARRAHELHHDENAAQHEQAVEQARADGAERQQIGDRPAAGERSAEYLGGDQDGGADDRQHVSPENAAGPQRRGGIHGGRTFLETEPGFKAQMPI